MIIEKEIKIKISKKNIDHIKFKGYDTKLKDIITIKTDDLNHGSHRVIRVKCDICGREKEIMYQKYIKNINNGGFYACSSKCAQIKVKNTSQIKYGVDYYMKTDEYKNRVEHTSLEKYGVRHHFCSNIVKEKIKKTNLEKYGVENPFQSEKIKERIKKTNLEKYGVENPSYCQDIKNLISEKIKLRWQLNIVDNKNVIKYENNVYTMMCEKNHKFKIHGKLLSNRKQIKTTICTVCNPLNSSKSGYENQLFGFVSDNYNNIVRNERKLLNNKYELDIYIPELKLAFEFNGIYWHNEINVSNNYHLNKTELCEEKGIQLIHIYEDDWLYKQDIVKSMILNKLNKSEFKIFARKTEVKEINDNKMVREFLEKNHVQGFIGSKIKLGLFYSENLVSLMSFGKRRIAMGKKKSKEGEYELLRFCSKLNTNVVGGANKLFKYFVKNYEPKTITTYADRSWSTGNLYKTLGFSFERKTEPNYYYIIDGIRHYRFNFRKDKLVKEGYNPLKTEHQIMIDRKIYRIYDSGNLKFLYIKNE